MKPKESIGILKGLALIAQAGLSIALPLVFFIWLGQRIADYTGSEGLLLIIGIFLGLVTGFMLVYRIFYKSLGANDNQE